MPKGTNGKTGMGVKCKKKAKRDRESADNIPLFDLDAVLLDTYNVLLKNEMLQEMYGEIMKRISMKPNPNVCFLRAPFEEALGGKLFTMDHIWREFNKIWTHDTVIKELIDCLCVPREFCSWLLLAIQETIVKQYLHVDELQPTLEVILTADEKDTVAYICGTVIKKLKNKAFDNIRKEGVSTALVDALKLRIELPYIFEYKSRFFYQKGNLISLSRLIFESTNIQFSIFETTIHIRFLSFCVTLDSVFLIKKDCLVIILSSTILLSYIIFRLDLYSRQWKNLDLWLEIYLDLYSTSTYIRRYTVLSSCQMPKGRVEGSSKLIETLSQGGLTCPCESFANIFLFVEKTFRNSVHATKTKLHVPEIVAKSMRDGSLGEKFLQLTNEGIVSSEAKLNTLDNCIT